jgi:hypothetical protein
MISLPGVPVTVDFANPLIGWSEDSHKLNSNRLAMLKTQAARMAFGLLISPVSYTWRVALFGGICRGCLTV